MITILEDKTQYFPGKVIYTIKIEVPKQDAKIIEVSRDIVSNKIILPDHMPGPLGKLVIKEIRNYIANIIVQGDY